MAAGMAAKGLSALADDDRAYVGERTLSENRLPGHHLLLVAEGQEGRPQEPGRRGSRTPEDLREAGHSAARAGDPGGRRGGRGVRQRFGGHHLQSQAEGYGYHLWIFFRSGAGASRAGEEVPGFGSAYLGQLLRSAEFGGLQRRLFLLRAEGRP